MKVIYEIGRVKNQFKGGVLVIGVFDGLHLGHQVLIKKAVLRACQLKTNAYVMTFTPHPVRVLHKMKNLSYIVSLPYRLKLMEHLGIKGCMMVHFTKRFAHLSPEKFVKRYLYDNIKPKEVFVGGDFRFGQHRKGTLKDFKNVGEKYGIKVNGVHPVKFKTGKVSSTDIRKLIAGGKLNEVKKVIGRDFAIMGKVVKGKKRGKTLGYPTANFNLRHEIIPPIGIYAVNVIAGNKKYHGMSSIGKRPTFEPDNMHVNIETHIFGFKGSLYGKEILVEFLKKIREEIKFPSKSALVDQIKKDEVVVRKFFANMK